MNSLTERISVLESLLRKNGIMPPPASLPIKYRTGNVADPFDQPLNGSTERSSADQEDADQREQSLSGNETSNRRSSAQDSPPLASPNSETTLVEKLLSNQAHFRYDALSGQFRYFGPTRNYHIYSEFLLQDSKADQLNGKNDVVDYILQNLAADTIDYLESLFWQYGSHCWLGFGYRRLTLAGITTPSYTSSTTKLSTRTEGQAARDIIPNTFISASLLWDLGSATGLDRT